MKLLHNLETGEKYYYKEKGDFHSTEGTILEKDIKEGLETGKNILKNNKDIEFVVFEPTDFDLSQKIKRGPQILIPKDLGYIIVRSGVNKNSTILEAGGGSGAATCFFGRFVKKVLTYEIRAEHCQIIQQNIDFFGLKNVELTNKDLKDDINKIKADFIFLDLPEPIPILSEELTKIKAGTPICCYLPSIYQIQLLTQFIEENKKKYLLEEITEIGQRYWKVTGKISRPEHRKETDHTAFLVFLKKIN